MTTLTLKELKQRLQGIEFSGYGHWKVTFMVRGKPQSTITTNVAAVDVIKEDPNSPYKGEGKPEYTPKGAYAALWQEVLWSKHYK